MLSVAAVRERVLICAHWLAALRTAGKALGEGRGEESGGPKAQQENKTMKHRRRWGCPFVQRKFFGIESKERGCATRSLYGYWLADGVVVDISHSRAISVSAATQPQKHRASIML